MEGAPQRLRCEYLDDPVGIDVIRPRLSWCVGDHRPAELQTAYQLLAASHLNLLALDEGDFWDSGRIEGRTTSQIEYAGKALISGRRVWWKVRSFDSDGLPSPWSEPALFEVGLLTAGDWQGRWISAGLVGSRLDPVPVPLFGRQFEIDQPVKSARLYLAAMGQIAVQINGQRIDLGEHSPNWVDYQTRVEYQTVDIGALLCVGRNSVAVLLADGWYAGDPGSGFRQQYGDKPSLLAQMNVILADASEIRAGSDSGWRWQPSWIVSSDPSRGERVDGARCRSEWLGEGPEQLGWYPVELGAHVADLPLKMSTSGPVPARGALIDGQKIRWQADLSRVLFEFPTPVMGRARVAFTVPDRGALRVRYGLELDALGELIAIGEDVCVALGDETGEVFEATFSLHGFRYVEISGDVYREDTVGVAAVPIAQPAAAEITLISDHPLLNNLHDLMFRQLSMTQQGIPVAAIDPVGRLGNAAEFGATVGARLLNMDTMPLVVRWLREMADAQFPAGSFPSTVPAPPGEEALCAEGPAGSSAAFVEVLWQSYRHSGDRALLRSHFPVVRALLAGGVEAARNFIREDLDASSRYPADLAATAWFFRSARLAARMAGVLGNLSDLEDCEELATNIRNAFRRRFVTPDGRVIGDDPAVYALVLGFGLLDRAEARRARRALIERCERVLRASHRERQTLLSHPLLLDVLTDQGRLDLAYRLVLDTPIEPDPHQAGRDVGQLTGAGVHEWLLSTLSGFRLSRDLSERHNAFRHMVIHPRPPLGFGDDSGEPPVRAVEAELKTINGRFESSWRITEQAFEIRVLVPGNCTAEIIMPDGTGHQVDAGEHDFSMVFGEAGDGIPVLREVS